jgi:hypothetical protein
MTPAAEPVGVLDGLAARVLSQYPYVFSVPSTPSECDVAYRIRYEATVGEGWATPEQFPDGLERDDFDSDAVQLVGWDGETPICTGRLVLPPAPLPTEQAAGIRIEPRGQVVDVGRMAVIPSYRTYRNAAFIALLCRLYLEMRNSGFHVACGMMSARVRTLTRQLGLQLELVGPELDYWGELRAPVRFALLASAQTLADRWRTTE